MWNAERFGWRIETVNALKIVATHDWFLFTEDVRALQAAGVWLVTPAILEYWVYERMDTEIFCGHLQFMCKCHTHSCRLIKEAAEVKGWPLKCTVLSKNTNSWSYFKKIVLWMNFFSVIYLIIVFVKVFINLGQIIITST